MVDPERFRSDSDEPMAARGMGAIYVRTHDGRPLKQAIDRDALLARYYDPHHQALGRWAREAVEVHGSALIIDCHSFPSRPLPCDQSQGEPRPDFCLGTDDYHMPPELTENLASELKKLGWSVGINSPYAGSMVPGWAFQRDSRVKSVMVEVSRRLYMDENTGGRTSGFESIKRQLTEVLESCLQGFR